MAAGARGASDNGAAPGAAAATASRRDGDGAAADSDAVALETARGQMAWSGEADCDGFTPHPMKPTMCTSCMSLMQHHNASAVRDADLIRRALEVTPAGMREGSLVFEEPVRCSAGAGGGEDTGGTDAGGGGAKRASSGGGDAGADVGRGSDHGVVSDSGAASSGAGAVAAAAAATATPHDAAHVGRLYVGGINALLNTARLVENGVTGVVSCAAGLDIFGPRVARGVAAMRERGMDHLQLTWYDDDTTDLSPEMPAALRFVRERMRRGEGVLVHCAQGKSRSGALAVAYVAASTGCSVAEALALVQKRRRMVQPNAHFMAQLEAMAREGLLREGEAGRFGAS